MEESTASNLDTDTTVSMNLEDFDISLIISFWHLLEKCYAIQDKVKRNIALEHWLELVQHFV